MKIVTVRQLQNETRALFDLVNKENEIIIVPRRNNKAVAIINQQAASPLLTGDSIMVPASARNFHSHIKTYCDFVLNEGYIIYIHRRDANPVYFIDLERYTKIYGSLP